MKKVLIILVLLFCFEKNIFSQVFYDYTLFTGVSMLEDGGGPAIGPNVGYSPRINFPLSEFHSFAISSNLKLFLSGTEAVALMFPIYAGFNFGALSTKDNFNKLGGYLNLGYGGLLYAYEDEGLAKGLTASMGARFRGGFDLGFMAFRSNETNLSLFGLMVGYSMRI